MHAVRLSRHGDPSVLEYMETPRPQPGPGDVLVKVRATSVNSWDIFYREGRVRALPGRAAFELPFQLGREVAGTVAETGVRVTRYSVGDRVVRMTCPACGHCAPCIRGDDNLCTDIGIPGHQVFGGYADYVVAPEHELLAAPEKPSYEELACTLWSYGTVWRMMHVSSGFRAGDDVLVTAASSGMGTACIQLARHLGAARVIALTGSANKESTLRKLGADHVLNYKTDEVANQVRALTAGSGVDFVLDNVGGEMFTLGMSCLREGGTVVTASSAAGKRVELDLSTLYRRNLTLVGSRASTRRDQQLVLKLAAAGVIQPVISQVFPLAEAEEAHRVLERAQHVGKLVLCPTHDE